MNTNVEDLLVHGAIGTFLIDKKPDEQINEQNINRFSR